jgi:hypothetical protein
MREWTVALAAHLLVVLVAGCATATVGESPVASVTPAETVASTPAPAGAASPTSTSTVHQALITVFKAWDADGDLNTTEDREAFAVLDFQPGEYPLAFELDLEGESGVAADVSTLPLDGVEQAAFMIEYEGEDLTATVTEIRKDDSKLLGAHCLNADTNEIVSGSGGDAISFDVLGSSEFVCTFFNTPVPRP